jgi:RNA polymerase sigma-70 factor (ECF subfamily)
MSLARKAAAGDDAATRRFLENVWPTMTRVISGVLGPRHPDIEDVVQQSMIGLVRALGSFRGECHPAGYASRIALHVALRARRRAGVERARSERLAQLTTPDADVPSPGEEALSERRRKLLRDLLEDLPEEQAEALALRIVLGWSLEEVAAATGAPINTIRSRVRLAKEALRRRIDRNPSIRDNLEVVR